jgi:hypothetical protein
MIVTPASEAFFARRERSFGTASTIKWLFAAVAHLDLVTRIRFVAYLYIPLVRTYVRRLCGGAAVDFAVEAVV